MLLHGDCLVSALFVETSGPYSEIAGVDLWDARRDARLYRGPNPVIAHPPCERWGSYWFGGPSAKIKKKLGDDKGCFKSALASVRRYGGILEHPARSHAWKAFGLDTPPKEGGWTDAGDGVGFTCHVEQGHYGHRARKPTWLYAAKVDLPDLIWGPCEGKMAIEESFRSAEARKAARAAGIKPKKRVNKTDLVHTPREFRDLLIKIVRSADALQIAKGRVG